MAVSLGRASVFNDGGRPGPCMKKHCRVFPGGLCTSTAEDKGLIPGGGAKIPQARECVKKKKLCICTFHIQNLRSKSNWFLVRKIKLARTKF